MGRLALEETLALVFNQELVGRLAIVNNLAFVGILQSPLLLYFWGVVRLWGNWHFL